MVAIILHWASRTVKLRMLARHCERLEWKWKTKIAGESHPSPLPLSPRREGRGGGVLPTYETLTLLQPYQPYDSWREHV